MMTHPDHKAELAKLRSAINRRNRGRAKQSADKPAPPLALEDCCRLGQPWALKQWESEHGRPWGSRIAPESATPAQVKLLGGGFNFTEDLRAMMNGASWPWG
jgi:hypothetical protein